MGVLAIDLQFPINLQVFIRLETIARSHVFESVQDLAVPTRFLLVELITRKCTYTQITILIN